MSANNDPAHLVLLHGWGMNSRVWQPVLPALTQLGSVTCLDLPGHGANAALPLGTLEQVAAWLAPQLPPRAVVVGWSLGGLVAQAVAHHAPQQVQGLVLVASTPKFVAEGVWQHGVTPQTLTLFGKGVQEDYHGTVKRFFALQFLNTQTDSRQVQALREHIMQQPASAQALQAGLEILRTADFTAHLPTQPTLWLFGRLDKLIPVTLAQALPTMGQQCVVVLEQAGHVPFVTHPQAFLQHLQVFLDAI